MKNWKSKKVEKQIVDAFDFDEYASYVNAIVSGLLYTMRVTRTAPMLINTKITRDAKIPCADWQVKLAGVVSLVCGTSVVIKTTKSSKQGRSPAHICFQGTAARCDVSVLVCDLIYAKMKKESGIIRRAVVEVMRNHSPLENRKPVRAFITAYCMSATEAIENGVLAQWQGK